MPGPTELREAVGDLVTLAGADLSQMWREAEMAAAVEEALRDVMPTLIATYGSAAAALAADWYDEERERVEARGRFTAIPAEVEDSGAQQLIGWALGEATDDAAFRSLILGGLQRRIANWSRGTITTSSALDPAAEGWQRVGNGGCAFCRMLISRGSVYSEATSDFASHDNCHCSAAPAWAGRARPVRPYTPSTHGSTDADRARVREWIAANL